MSEQNIAKTTPTIADAIREKLTGRIQQNALQYIAFLKERGILGDFVYYVPGGYLCNISIDNNSWGISMEHIDSVLCRHEYQEFPVDANVKEFAWAHVSICENHGCGFNPGRRVSLFGKEFHNTCFGLMSFESPDGEDLELLTKLTVAWKQMIDDATMKGSLYVPKKNEWSIVRHTDVNAGKPLGRAYTKSLDVEFYITPKTKFVNRAAIGFSGGGLIPVDCYHFPVALGIGAIRLDRFEAIKGSAESYTYVETLKYQQNMTYCVDMSINITNNTYDVTVWMLDEDGRPDTPYCIAKDFPFRLEAGSSPMKAIDTIYPVYVYNDASYIIKDFKIVRGE